MARSRLVTVNDATKIDTALMSTSRPARMYTIVNTLPYVERAA